MLLEIRCPVHNGRTYCSPHTQSHSRDRHQPPSTPIRLPATISSQELPPAESATFRESSFFSRNGPGAELPCPADVRARGAVQNPKWWYPHVPAPPPVRYEELGLLVKLGRGYHVTVAEGQCLWALGRVLPGVPVPEVYGWTHDNGQVFIYMELVPHSVTLEQRWDALDEAARLDICKQLRLMLLELRTLRHAPGAFFLGRINRDPLGDIVFTNENRPPAGPFTSVVEFHDWMSTTINTPLLYHFPGKELSEIPDPYRDAMPDDWDVVFTHADLHPSNIMVSDGSNESSCKITAIIDWHQSGWYPDYWEFCKAAYTADFDGEWLRDYIPRFLDEPSCWDAFENIARSFGY